MDIHIEKIETERDDPTDDSQQNHTNFGSWKQADDEIGTGTRR